MRRIGHGILLMVISIIGFTSCMDDGDFFDPKKRFEEEKPIIKAYVTEKFPEAVYDSVTGIWYKVLESGTAGSYTYKVKDTANSKLIQANVKVKYSVRLTNGVEIDKSPADTGMNMLVGANLNTGAKSVINAWLYAFFPKKIGEYNLNGLTVNGLQKGAKIRLVTPSLWAYGHQSVGKVPEDAPLDFTIEVMDIKD
ncbi:FKBP-type peptidyl-prolyl cis-trans isomerase [Sphingobacterium spiritivorum]|uniref:FKBP-type peptidyl-prolyl cis-trans isomerase n=1 Tax=Sphingobacterium spiritivorum TaxID=258 RepID=UPI003DA1FB2A